MSRAAVSGYLILASVALLQFVILPARERNMEMAQTVKGLKEEIGQLRRDNIKLGRTIKALKSDPYYVEYMLRSRLRYRGPDEEGPTEK